MHRRIAIIPARGGSKRIPYKNIIEFEGKPLIAWTIRAALDTGLFEQVLVSTDDPKIAEVSKEYGASAPFLRENAADDMSPVSVATLHALKQAEVHWASSFDTVVQLMPNCPLRDAENIHSALTHFDNEKHNFQISCCQFGWLNPWWAARLDKSGQPVRLFDETVTMRSQDMEELFCPTGAIWIAGANELKAASTFYGPGHVFCPMPWKAAIDIDEMDDLEMAIAVSRMAAT